MTAQVVVLYEGQAQVDETIRRTVRGLMKGRGLSVEEIAPRVDMSVATLYRRLQSGVGSAFKAGEVAALASFFGLKVEDLFSGLEGRFTPEPPPTSIEDSLPRLDSNQQPFDSRFPQVRLVPVQGADRTPPHPQGGVILAPLRPSLRHAA